MGIKIIFLLFIIFFIIFIVKIIKYNEKKKFEESLVKEPKEEKQVAELIKNIDEKLQQTKKEFETNRETLSKKLQILNEDLVELNKIKIEKNGQEHV